MLWTTGLIWMKFSENDRRMYIYSYLTFEVHSTDDYCHKFDIGKCKAVTLTDNKLQFDVVVAES